MSQSPARAWMPALIVTMSVLACLPLALVQGGTADSENSSETGKSAAESTAAPGDQTQRIRELIYVFRHYRVFSRDEEWAQTIRELVTIGKPAVPELIAELDQTDRDQTLRSLGFTLRAIGDPRAVPALIRAIPRTLRPPGSDCGVGIIDPELRAFMLKHQNYKDEEGKHVACGRPVNEIIPALERITSYHQPTGDDGKDPLRHVFLGGTAEQQADQRRIVEAGRQGWQAWWDTHWQDFVSKEELQSVELPERKEDLVEAAGLKKFGPLFPTGGNLRLSPVRELSLDSATYWNGKSHIDFDTGRVYEYLEGSPVADSADETGSRFGKWHREKGIDARCQGSIDGVDLHLWLIDDRRWETIEREIASGRPLPRGQEATSWLTRFDKSRTDFKWDQLATFLFTTREGGRGIVQVFPKDADSDGRRLRYRMWTNADAKPADQAVADSGKKTGGTKFGKPATRTLAMPAEGDAFLLDLENGKAFRPPEFLKAADFANSTSLPANKEFVKWCRENGIDAFAGITEIAYSGLPAGGKPRPNKALVLIGLEMTSLRVLPKAFDEMTVEEARELLGRTSAQKAAAAWLMIDINLADPPDTFAFQTRAGSVGLVQIEELDESPGKLTISYRLHAAAAR